jgi:hypothetical protein
MNTLCGTHTEISSTALRLLIAMYNGGHKKPGAMINVPIAGIAAGLEDDDVFSASAYLETAGLIAPTNHPYFFTMMANGVEAIENGTLTLMGTPARDAPLVETALEGQAAAGPSYGEAPWQGRMVLPVFRELIGILDRDRLEASLDEPAREAVFTDIQSMRSQLHRENPNWIVIRGALAEMESYIPAMPAATEAFQKAARLLGLG